MAIEFQCDACEALLRMHGGTAGSTVTCPHCGQRVTVVPVDSVDVETGEVEVAADVPRWPEPDENPGVEEGAFGEFADACPVCGTRRMSEEDECRACGHSFAVAPAPLDVSDVLRTSWRIFAKEIGPCIGGFVVSSMIYACTIVLAVVGVVLLAVIAHLQQPAPDTVVIWSVIGMLVLCLLFVGCYFQAGTLLFYEGIAKGRPPDFKLLFGGRRFTWRLVALNVVSWFVILLGTLAFVVPGVILFLVFWPAPSLLVDQDVGVFESLARSARLTRGSRGAILVLTVLGLLAATAASVLFGMATLVVGPFLFLMYSVAYLSMTGHPIPVPD